MPLCFIPPLNKELALNHEQVVSIKLPRRAWVVPMVGIHPNESGIDLRCDTMRSREIRSPNSRSESIFAGVCKIHAFLLFLYQDHIIIEGLKENEKRGLL